MRNLTSLLLALVLVAGCKAPAFKMARAAKAEETPFDFSIGSFFGEGYKLSQVGGVVVIYEGEREALRSVSCIVCHGDIENHPELGIDNAGEADQSPPSR